MFPPILVSFIYEDGSSSVFVDGFLFLLGSGVVFWLPNRKETKDLRSRDGFMVVAVFWVVVSAAGSLPFILAENPHMSFTDAFFESVSGLTQPALQFYPEWIAYHIQSCSIVNSFNG